MSRQRSVAAALLAGAAACFTAASSHAKTSWQLVYNQPNQGNALASVSAIDATNAWAIGVAQMGTSSSPIGIRTVDGVSWSPFTLPMGTGPLDLYLFLEIAFADAQVGWMGGVHLAALNQENVLFRTDNGGSTWTEALKPAAMIEQIHTLSTGEMFGVGGSALVRSTDGITAVESVVSVPAGLGLRGIYMLNRDCGYAVASSDPDSGGSQSVVLWTGDGGDTWEERGQDGSLRLDRIWFVSADLGWAAGTSAAGAGIVARSTDGGRAWTAATLPDHPPALGGQTAPVTECGDVRFFDDQRGVALCLCCTGECDSDSPSYMTVFARTEDGGQSWQMDPDYELVMSAPPFGDMMKFSGMFDMAFPSPNAGYLVGQNNLVLRYSADAPEAEGWGPADCSSGGVGGGGTSPPGGGAAPGAGDGSEEDSGCGCRVGPRRTSGPGGHAALALAAMAAVRRRRRR
ncbi:MAG: hypothetical protein JRI23_01885 [Deltaproteobacteria bacterium]|nr:hypothetical protein [Deltaproteobacteria bacterium]MBW2530225.1 hypothetical protein [Deltaproteobacteria bacterium]